MKEAYVALGVVVFTSLMAGYSFGRAVAEKPYRPARLSGNCGPAAQGLTPDADVMPIKVDRGGHVIVSQP